jgi:hypothetical protein
MTISLSDVNIFADEFIEYTAIMPFITRYPVRQQIGRCRGSQSRLFSPDGVQVRRLRRVARKILFPKTCSYLKPVSEFSLFKRPLAAFKYRARSAFCGGGIDRATLANDGLIIRRPKRN